VRTGLTFNNCTLSPYCIDVFCIYLRTNNDFAHLKDKLIGFYSPDKSVYCEVRTGPLNVAPAIRLKRVKHAFIITRMYSHQTFFIMLGYTFHHFEFVIVIDLRSSSYTPEVLLLDHIRM